MTPSPDDQTETRDEVHRTYYLALVILLHAAALLWVGGWLGAIWNAFVGLIIALPVLVLAVFVWRHRRVPFRIKGRSVQRQHARPVALGLAAGAVMAATFDVNGPQIARWVRASLEGSSR